MCVDYTDLNRACPKDVYPLPNIDKLVNNSSGYKLFHSWTPILGTIRYPWLKTTKKNRFHDQIGELLLPCNALRMKKQGCHLSTNDEQGIQQRTSR